MRVLAPLFLFASGAPALAQDHSGHAMPKPEKSASTPSACEQEAARHRAMGHPVPDDFCEAKTVTEELDGKDHNRFHSAMDHGSMPSMDHSAEDHSAMDHSAMADGPILEVRPPAAAGSGPPRAADAIWGAEAMAASRDALRRENGGQQFATLLIDRLEYKGHEGGDGYAWEGQAWFGGDIDRFTLRSEGEGTFGGEAEQAELQALWSHAIGPWFDLNLGLRQDFAGSEQTHLAVGVQGLAPYFFEVDGTAFLSTEGDLTASFEAELDQRITQRLILQPRVEMNLSAQDVPELGIGAGLDTAEAEIRLRYELAREFAPYVGVSQEWRVGTSADYARARGDETTQFSFVAGVRFWF